MRGTVRLARTATPRSGRSASSGGGFRKTLDGYSSFNAASSSFVGGGGGGRDGGGKMNATPSPTGK